MGLHDLEGSPAAVAVQSWRPVAVEHPRRPGLHRTDGQAVSAIPRRTDPRSSPGRCRDAWPVAVADRQASSSNGQSFGKNSGDGVHNRSRQHYASDCRADVFEEGFELCFHTVFSHASRSTGYLFSRHRAAFPCNRLQRKRATGYMDQIGGKPTSDNFALSLAMQPGGCV